MLQIKPFEAIDILYITPREPDKSIAGSVPDYLAVAELYEKQGPAFTALLNDKPIFCAGLIELMPGLAEGWAFTSETVAKVPLSFHKAVKTTLDGLIVARKLRRIQVAIPEYHTVSCEWILHLGFHEESKMPKFGPKGETYFRYVRFA